MAASTSSLILAVAVITMCAGSMAAAQTQAPAMAPGPSSYAGGMAPPAYVGISPEPSVAMPPESMGPSSSGSQECLNYLLNMSDCLSYVQTGSNMSVPDKACCPELDGLLESHPLCLCEFVGSASAYGVDITKALTLPGACGLPPLSLSLCPGQAPGGSPAGSPDAAVTPAGFPVGSSIAQPPSSRASTIAGFSSLVFLLALGHFFSQGSLLI